MHADSHSRNEASSGAWTPCLDSAELLMKENIPTANVLGHVRPDSDVGLPASLPYIALYLDTTCGQVVHPVFFRILQT